MGCTTSTCRAHRRRFGERWRTPARRSELVRRQPFDVVGTKDDDNTRMNALTKVAITVNGQPGRHDIEPRLLLVYFLRDFLGLTGTNVGCDTSTCGACTVHVDGR